VIKIEKPGGDPSRQIGPFLEDSPNPERSFFFFHNNTNKLGITLNLEHENGKEIFFKLLRKTDVVVETSPDYIRQNGLNYDALHIENIRLIHVSVTGFGQNGPRSQYRSCDLVASAFGGRCMSPVLPQPFLSDPSETNPITPLLFLPLSAFSLPSEKELGPEKGSI